MNTILISSIVFSVSILALSLLLGHTYLKYQKLLMDHKKLSAQKKANVLVDLEIATSEQLIKELRQRPGHPYLMISKTETETQSGLNIEVHNIPPQQCFYMLHSATGFMFNEMKQRGIMPMPDDEDNTTLPWEKGF